MTYNHSMHGITSFTNLPLMHTQSHSSRDHTPSDLLVVWSGVEYKRLHTTSLYLCLPCPTVFYQFYKDIGMGYAASCSLVIKMPGSKYSKYNTLQCLDSCCSRGQPNSNSTAVTTSRASFTPIVEEICSTELQVQSNFYFPTT